MVAQHVALLLLARPTKLPLAEIKSLKAKSQPALEILDQS
jgi:hypothetical protein